MTVEAKFDRVLANPPPGFMELNTFALIIGLTCYLVGLPLLLTEKQAVNFLKKVFKSDEPFISLIGVITFLICAATLRRQWDLTPDAEGLVVLMAWVGLFKGLFFAWQPKEASRIVLHVLTKHANDLLYGFFSIVWGALFTYLGFAIA